VPYLLETIGIYSLLPLLYWPVWYPEEYLSVVSMTWLLISVVYTNELALPAMNYVSSVAV